MHCTASKRASIKRKLWPLVNTELLSPSFYHALSVPYQRPSIIFHAQHLSHLDFIPLAIGAVSATVGVLLTPVVAPAAVGVVGFGAAGPVAGVPHSSH